MNDEKNKATGYPSVDRPWLKYYSDEARNFEMPECTIYDYLWENNKEHLDNVALNYFGNKISYGKMLERINKTAQAFAGIGIKENDIVIIAAVTIPEVIYSFYALNLLGQFPIWLIREPVKAAFKNTYQSQKPNIF